MIKSKILKKLRLHELIGTNFESLMNIITMKKGDIFYYSQVKKMTAIYIFEGAIQYIIYSPDGGEFYIDHFSGDVVGIGATLSRLSKIQAQQNFEVDLTGKEDSIIVTLPFEEIFDMKLEKKEEVLKKLFLLFLEEHSRVSEYFLNKSIYSDEAFFIKFLENHKSTNKTIRELSELLNINLRTLQRIVKRLQEVGVIVKENEIMSIGNQDKIEEYKIKFKK